MRWSGWVVGIALLSLGGGLAYLHATGRDETLREKVERMLVDAQPSDPSEWPGPAARLQEPVVAFPEGFGVFRVVVDPGHGAEGNTGNLSSFCQDEQDFTMALGEELAKHLRGTGHFDAELSRQGEALVPYPDRVSSSEQWEAHVFLSLHSDVRGQMQVWDPDGGQQCPRSEAAPGFSVLWSDDGEQGTRRRTLARTLATNMARAGFLAYPGEEYELYEGDEVVPGVFVDRHPPGKRIYVLHKPKMPSVIVETHNAWDPREARRWKEAEARRVFFQVVTASLVAFLSTPEK